MTIFTFERVCHENLEHIEDLKRCSCKKLAKARFDYFNDGQNSNLNQKPSNSFQNFQKQSKALENGLRKRKGSKSSKEDGDRQETAKVRNISFDKRYMSNSNFTR